MSLLDGHEANHSDPITEWALRAREGDSSSYAAFVRSSQADVWRCCAAIVAPEAADDLTQETYLRAFRALPEFAGRSSARTWLLSIARRVCADHLRSVVRQRRLDAWLHRPVTTLVAAPTADPAETHATQALLASLSHERRSAFVLTQLLGLSYEEAATVEGVAVGTIRSRIARARADLVAMLATAAAA